MQKLHRWTGDEPTHPPTPPLLYHVAYCSRASREVDQAALQRIVATAQRYNPAHGITGMLVFGSGIFFQWLEGPHEHVVALMQRLRGDPHEQTAPTTAAHAAAVHRPAAAGQMQRLHESPQDPAAAADKAARAAPPPDAPAAPADDRPPEPRGEMLTPAKAHSPAMNPPFD